ncbi:MAG: hypothetical protein GXO62_08405 [Epsilonproteobacteria bacterium]|nr:hypothetical protein [Campylobacterota bacterium]
MKKFALLALATFALASEFQYGNGKFKIDVNFPMFSSGIDLDVESFSFVENHKNILGTSWFYKYDLTYYKSKTLDDMISTLNSNISMFNNYSPVNAPVISYKLRGIDFNLIVGKDLYTKNNARIGLGALVGVSVPWLESKSKSNIEAAQDYMKALEDSKTKVMTYKVGMNLNGAYTLNKFVNFYASTSYAYQMGKIKNDYVDVEVKGTGHYSDLDLGVRITPLSVKKKIWFITLNPKVYATLGFKYKYWKLKRIESNVMDIDGYVGDVEFKNKMAYFGLGYDF